MSFQRSISVIVILGRVVCAFHLLILGYGRVGRDIAHDASSSLFTTITGTVRQEPSLDGPIHLIPFQNKHIQPLLSNCSHIIITLPPPRDESDDELDAVLQSMEECFPPNGWIGIISTTGVYGDHQGAWVTETSVCQSASKSALRFFQWEHDWRDQCQRTGHQLAIFRCAGIYGPDRSALHTAYREPVASGGGGITNRIHTHDLSRAVVACMRKSRICGESNSMGDCEIFNLADDLPESRTVVLEYARDLLQGRHAAVPVETVKTSNRARRRETEEKRVCNRKMKEILLDKTELTYPTYKEGLQHILEQQSEPW
jgi:nucleoside-diphosphate-sugar epimerase